MSTRGPIVFLAVLFAGYVGICILYADRMNRWGMDDAAIDNAQRYTDVVSAFRTTYTAQVVSKAENYGMGITHDHTMKEAIPLPATMSILIGEQLAKEERGLQVKLYSPHPFPWRQEEGGLKDEFAVSAWKVLNEDKLSSHHEFMESAGERYIRYAVADVMRPQCVGCHNTHLQSPKTDWKAGEVRGVLEVSFPVAKNRRAWSPFLGGLFLFLTGCAAFLVVAIVLRRLRDQIEAKRLSEAELAAAHLEIHQSRQRVVEEKLEVIGHVAAGIAHDFNNVLMIVLGYTDMALKNVVHGSNVAKYLEKSRIATRRARALANKLPIMHSHQGFHPVQMDLYESVMKTADLLQPLLSRSDITFEIIASEEQIEISGEPDQIERLLINLILNALDAVRGVSGEGRIFINIESYGASDESQAVLTVRDTGPGISEVILPELFKPFFTTKTTGDTAGLGLFTVQQIADQHGGSIEVESPPGSGATFRIIFPVSSQQHTTRSNVFERLPRIPSDRPAHILVVDDDREVQDFLLTALTQADYRVTLASNGEEAMEIFGERADDFDLVLTDVRMPRMDGREFGRSVRELRPQQRLMFISGYEEDVERVENEFQGEIPFLKKPVGPNDIVDAVQAVLSLG